MVGMGVAIEGELGGAMPRQGLSLSDLKPAPAEIRDVGVSQGVEVHNPSLGVPVRDLRVFKVRLDQLGEVFLAGHAEHMLTGQSLPEQGGKFLQDQFARGLDCLLAVLGVTRRNLHNLTFPHDSAHSLR